MDGVWRYAERQRPMIDLDDLVRQQPPPPGFRTDTRSAISTFVTDECEQGRWMELHGTIGDRRAAVGYGIVLLDDCYACLIALAFDGQVELELAQARAALIGDVQAAGYSRRRRYAFALPAGWALDTVDTFQHAACSADGRARVWLGVAFPSDPGQIPAAIRHVAGDRPCEIERVATPSLTGVRVTIPGSERVTTLVFLEDPRFVYGLRLEAPAGEGEHALGQIVDSIQPIPFRARTSTVSPLLFSHLAS